MLPTIIFYRILRKGQIICPCGSYSSGSTLQGDRRHNSFSGQAWQCGLDAKERKKQEKAIEKIAADLEEMYAYRKVTKRFSLRSTRRIVQRIEATFNYEETPDQDKAIQGMSWMTWIKKNQWTG